jgi:zinc protease
MTVRAFRFLFLAVALLAVAPLAAQPPSAAPQSSAPPSAAPPSAAPPSAAKPSAAKQALADAMPVDGQITRGTLPNGLRYYVRANRKPEKRAELRLVVKAGSILEDEDQQGLAHFVEHMAFNGTSHFPKHEIVSFLESLGMRFGADINASTGFDETVYMLQVPTDKPGTLDRSMLILEDWAHNVSFDPVEIDKERGVVMEEWRGRRGAGARVQDKMLPILLKGSRYADRVPIGKTEILQGFKPERLTKFYADWYRPELMAVVAVGDFDQAEVEALIKRHFAGLAAPSSVRPRATYDVPDHAGTVYSVITDKEMTTTSVEVDYLLPARANGTVGAYRQRIVDRLFGGLLSARLGEISQKPGAPYLGASAGRGPFLTRTKEIASLRALVKDGGVEPALEAILAEKERVARFGFTQTELDRLKQAMLRGLERVYAEKDSRTSSSRADEYVRNFLVAETLPPLDVEYALNQRFIPEITLAEVNRLARDWYPEGNRLVVVTAPEKAGVAVPDEAGLAAVLAAAAGTSLTAYVDKFASAALLETPPSSSPVVRTRVKAAIEITEWELANGVKVILKPTTFKQDEILFRATSPGGTSLASDADFIPASTATQVVTAGGLGKFSSADLRKVLTGKIAAAVPFISELEEGLSGSASPKDLETLFQLIYLRFTAPRADPTIFSVQTSQLKTLMANQANTPGYAFTEALATIMGRNHPRRRLPTPATVDEWNLDKSMAFYKDRFADASDFTFVFVGNLDPAVMKPLVERYLGGLPSLRRKETWKDVEYRAPTGVITKTVEKGLEPKSQAAIIFTGPFQYDQASRIAIRAMADVLQTRLLDAIREDLGGTYSISASPTYGRIPIPTYTMSIAFGCDPKRLDELVGRVMQESEKLKTEGPTEKQVADERAALERDFETSSKQNAYLLGQLMAKYQTGEDPAGIWALPELYQKVDAATIQQAARKYLSGENRVQVTLVPETK